MFVMSFPGGACCCVRPVKRKGKPWLPCCPGCMGVQDVWGSCHVCGGACIHVTPHVSLRVGAGVSARNVLRVSSRKEAEGACVITFSYFIFFVCVCVCVCVWVWVCVRFLCPLPVSASCVCV